MGYVVHHLNADGAVVLEDLPTLEEALARVEVLQNDGQASRVRVLKEVPIQVRTYYRVVAVEESPEPPAVAEAPEDWPPPVQVTMPEPAEPTAPQPVVEAAPEPAEVEVPEPVAEVAPEPTAEPSHAEVSAAAPPEVAAPRPDEEPAAPSPKPEPRREAPVRLQPPPGAMLISPAPAAAARAETREPREPAHRSLFSRG